MSGLPDAGTVRVPGDKSLSHRALILATLAAGTSRLRGLLDAADVRSTADCLRGIGAEIPDGWRDEVRVRGPAPFRSAERVLDCGNSGTSARILAGLAAGLGVEATLDGDDSLRARPMERVVYPLQAMGAEVDYLDERGRLPFRIQSRATGSLRRLKHLPKVASAQVKSCMLLAGLTAGVRVEVMEPGRSRDHTERMLRALGAPVDFEPVGEDARIEEGMRVVLEAEGWEGDLRPLDIDVPGDLSSASFLLGAALLLGRSLEVEGVGLNPSRAGVLDVLRRAGARIEERTARREAGEPVGTLRVEPGELRPFRVEGEEVPTLLDEVPLLAAVAARLPGWSEIRGAEELRVKESDRLSTLARNLEALGVECEERRDGLRIHGTEEPLSGPVRTGGDHRIAMAFGVLGALPGNRIDVDRPGCVRVSYPSFWDDLGEVTGGSP